MRTSLRLLFAWLVEFGPILGFFTSLFLRGDSKHGFIASTNLFVFLTVLAMLVAYVKDKRLALFPLVTGLSVILFGVATAFLKDPRIFMVKDTIYNAFFGLVLLVGLVKGKGYLKYLFATLFDMSDRGWYVLSLRWTVMFFLLAISNEIVRESFDQHAWVFYKLYATLATLVFGVYQIVLARKERNPGASAWGMRLVAQDPHF